jgi:glycosyltransferase involved in cell wall biosynthesis
VPDVVIVCAAIARSAVIDRFPRVPTVYLPHARIAPEEVAGVLNSADSRMRHLAAVRSQYRAERTAILRSAATIRFTPGLADVLTRYYRLPTNVRFEVIPQAVDVPATVPPPRSGPIRLLVVGRLVESKNVGLVLSALAGVDGAWHLDVLGDGPEQQHLVAAAARTGLANRVTFHGQVDDPARFYTTADLLAFPSRQENVSLVVLEAMGHGVPALTIRADGSRYRNVHHEVIRDGVDGLIADGEADFSFRLRSAVGNPSAIRALGPAARVAAERHDWPMALNRWEQLLAAVRKERGTHISAINGRGEPYDQRDRRGTF